MNEPLQRALDLFAGYRGASCAAQPAAENPGTAHPLPISLRPSRRLIRDLKSKGYVHSHQFVLLPSLKNPRWLLPLGNSKAMAAGSQIYVPHRRIARLMKGLLVNMIKRGWNGWGCRKALVASSKPLPFEDLVREVTGEARPLFAMSLGSRPAVSKLTLQAIAQDGKILGYFKVPLSDVATERVRHEAAILERLWNFPGLRPHIPRLFYSGTWHGTYLLFQSPLDGEPSPANFSSVHERFLRALQDIHGILKPGARLVQEVAAKWEKAAVRLPSLWQELGEEALQRSTRCLRGRILRCGPAHGDFAPWNMRIQRDGLLLFDWESADWEAPHGWDNFHFHVQTASSLGTKNGRSFLARADDERKALYILYLLSSVCQFLEEENQQAIEYRRNLLTPLILPSN